MKKYQDGSEECMLMIMMEYDDDYDDERDRERENHKLVSSNFMCVLVHFVCIFVDNCRAQKRGYIKERERESGWKREKEDKGVDIFA